MNIGTNEKNPVGEIIIKIDYDTFRKHMGRACRSPEEFKKFFAIVKTELAVYMEDELLEEAAYQLKEENGEETI